MDFPKGIPNLGATKKPDGEHAVSPSRRIILALKEQVLIPLEAKAELNPAEKRAVDHLNDGLLWLMENERAAFFKGAQHGQAN